MKRVFLTLFILMSFIVLTACRKNETVPDETESHEIIKVNNNITPESFQETMTSNKYKVSAMPDSKDYLEGFVAQRDSINIYYYLFDKNVEAEDFADNSIAYYIDYYQCTDSSVDMFDTYRQWSFVSESHDGYILHFADEHVVIVIVSDKDDSVKANSAVSYFTSYTEVEK